MKSITTWIITGGLLAGAAVSYISKEFSDSSENQYVEHTEESLSADIADFESTETSTTKDKEGIRPEDIIHYDPKAIGKSVVEHNGRVFVDLEGYGNSDESKELKAFQKYGSLMFNGKIQIEFNPSYFDGYYWEISLRFDKWNEKLGTIELPWGKITVLEPTYAYLDFGSLRFCEVNYFHTCRENNGRKDDDEITEFARQSTKPYADSYGISYILSLVRKSDNQTGVSSGYL